MKKEQNLIAEALVWWCDDAVDEFWAVLSSLFRFSFLNYVWYTMNPALNSQCMHDLGQKVNAGWRFCDPSPAGDVYSAGPDWHLRHPLQRALPADSVNLPSLAEYRWEHWEQVDGKNKRGGDSWEKSNYHHLRSIGENTVSVQVNCKNNWEED